MTRTNISATLAIAFGLLTGAATPISYAGDGDFHLAVDKPSETITTGGEARFKVTFTSVGGFGGEVRPNVPKAALPPRTTANWSSSRVKVPPNGSATTILTIQADITTPPGVYQIAPQAAGASVTHVIVPAIVLTVVPPKPGTITATLSPDRPIVGVTPVRISGRGTAGLDVSDTTTFPDGIPHLFALTISGGGHYIFGPFVLRQLGIYHDVLVDLATGAKVEISYQGVGDFSTSVDRTSATVTKGEEAKFKVTFKSLSGFAGKVKPAVPDLSRIAGASASWSSPAAMQPVTPGLPNYSPLVMVRSDDSAVVELAIKTSSATPPGTYKFNVQGTNGSVTHAAPSEIELTVEDTMNEAVKK